MADDAKSPRPGPIKRALIEELKMWPVVGLVMVLAWVLGWLG